MSVLSVDLDESLVALLRHTNPNESVAAREMIVLELFRRGEVSSGRAARMLGMVRKEFLKYASRLGIAVFDLSAEEWEQERKQCQAFSQGDK